MKIKDTVSCICLLLGVAGPMRAGTDEVRIHMDAAQSVAPVNTKIFGQFILGADNYGVFSIPYPDLAVLHEGDGIWNPATNAPYPDVLALLNSYHPGLLRYPGGLEVQKFDWKKTIGPLAKRGDWKFGLNEFLQVCADVKAEPIIAVSEYTGTPQDAADLVEYLNMPAEVRYPWAMKRADDGHPAPYGVRYFEMGNESWVQQGGGGSGARSPQGTGLYASELAHAMKAIDRGIECGVPFLDGDDQWNAGVLDNIGEGIDFVIIHTYPVKYGGGDLTGEKEDRLLEAMMAAGYTTSLDLVRYREDIRRFSGRDMPVAVTEYNMGPTQMSPHLTRPYRFSLAAALGQGDYLGRLMQPGTGVLAAVYWNWLNGFFESVQTYAGNTWKTRAKLAEPEFRPAHYIFQLWGEYRGATVLPVQVVTPMLDFAGFNRTTPCLGAEGREAERVDAVNILAGAHTLAATQPGITIKQLAEGEWSIHFEKIKKGAFPPFLMQSLSGFPPAVKPPVLGLVYHMSFEAKWVPEGENASPNVGVGVMDSRGWSASGSAIAVYGVQSAHDWTKFSSVYRPLADTSGVVILGRLEDGASLASGTLLVRNLSLEPWLGTTYPARPALTAYATRSADGRELHLVVYNLTLSDNLTGEIAWDGFKAASATYSEVDGKSAAAVNDSDSPVGWIARDAPLALSTSGMLSHTFPAHSATGITLERISP